MSTKAKRPTWIVRVGMAHKRLLISGRARARRHRSRCPRPDRDHAHADRLGHRRADLSVAAAIVMMSRAPRSPRCGATPRRRTRARWPSWSSASPPRWQASAPSSPSLQRSIAPTRSYGLYIALAIATVVLSWTFTHTIFALHYAHEFYGEHARQQRPQVSRRWPAGLLGLHLFRLRHRHDVPGLGCRRHPQVGPADWWSPTACCRSSSPPPSSRMTVNIAANIIQR